MSEDVSGALSIMDEWCVKKLEQLSPVLHKHVLAGRDLNSPHYRRMLGEADAYMKMRSFIHGCRAPAQGEGA